MSSAVKMMDTEVVDNSLYKLPSSHGLRDNSLTSQRSRFLETMTPNNISPSTDPGEIKDLLLVGFGPASLAIAIALHDASSTSNFRPKVSFLERQTKFAWHSGMQLPGAKMQISFLKDLATPRNPQSHFTFINYLYSQHRLNTFINLSTFLPSRAEYEDYLRWCAGHFERDGVVSYGQEVVDVAPESRSKTGKVTSFRVASRDVTTGKITIRLARHVVIAVGGRAIIPPEFAPRDPRVFHSSTYSLKISSALSDPTAPYNIVVIGNGQSAAEIFNDLPGRYPNAKVTLIIKGAALRPSDDSPFVNEIFDPDRVNGIYGQSSQIREDAIKLDKATNYGVVRLELLEHLYEKMYTQRLLTPDPANWRINIRTNRKVTKTESVVDAKGDEKLLLRLGSVIDEGASELAEELAVDAVFVATGYMRNAHEEMLSKTRNLLPQEFRDKSAKFPVRRDYKVVFDEERVAEEAGIWLQGCNEKTHGLSDTLLSILAIRGGEMVESIFGQEITQKTLRAKL